MVKHSESSDDVTNVYRTADFIVKQSVIRRDDDMGTYLFSRDTFIHRTTQRDREYEEEFGYRRNIDGLRIPTKMSSRRYIY